MDNTNKNMINILDLIKQDSTKATTWVEYQHGIQFNLRFVTKGELTQIIRECTVQKFDPKSRTRVPTTDNEAVTAKFAARAVVGWKGVTPRSLAKVVLTNEVPAEQMDVEIPFSVDGLLAVAKQCFDLDAFLQEMATDPRVFNPDQEEEEKNLSSSPSGN